MPMNPRLLRPRQTIHPEAADWANRVRANGGSVSGTTLTAVDRFVKAVYTTGIRDSFYRLNLFAGTGLEACLVPLFRNTSFSGAALGNATDTNNNFISSDYSETGASGGLLGNGSTKYLNTGLAPSALPSVATGHLSVYVRDFTPANTNTTCFIGAASGSHQYQMLYRLNGVTQLGESRVVWGGVPLANGSEPAGFIRGGLRLLTRTGATALRVYRNSDEVFLSETSMTPAAHSNNWFVFASNSAGTPQQHTPERLSSYSIGASMTAAQVASYSTAMQAFQAALGRQA